MKLNFKTLCPICCALLYGSVLADAGESKVSRQSSVGKIVKNINEMQRKSSEQYDRIKESSSEWFSAAETGDLQTMKTLYNEAYKYHRYIYTRDDSERTALEIAITNGHADVVEWLADRIEEQEYKDKASNFNLRSLNKDHKPMMIVAVEKGYEDIVKIMLLRNIDPDVRIDMSISGKGKNPLIVAAENGYTNIVDLLLTSKGDPDLLKIGRARSDPNLQDLVNRTALMYAAQKGHIDIVKLLLNNKADPNKKDKWEDTALILATIEGYESVVELLLDYGADPDAKNKDKETALICAACKGYYNIAKVLLEKGAKINIKDKNGKTALDYAANDEMTKLLMNYIDRPENQKKEKNPIKKVLNKLAGKNVDKKALNQNKRLSADSEATLYENEVGQDIDDLLSSTETLVDN